MHGENSRLEHQLATDLLQGLSDVTVWEPDEVLDLPALGYNEVHLRVHAEGDSVTNEDDSIEQLQDLVVSLDTHVPMLDVVVIEGEHGRMVRRADVDVVLEEESSQLDYVVHVLLNGVMIVWLKWVGQVPHCSLGHAIVPRLAVYLLPAMRVIAPIAVSCSIASAISRPDIEW